MKVRVYEHWFGQGGYTLLELLTVLLVMGMMFALTLPGVTRLFQREQLDMAARTITAEIRSGQVSAVAHQDVHEIWFNKFQPSYTIWEGGQNGRQVRLPDGLRYRNGYLEQTVSQLRFDGAGVTSGSGSIRLVNQTGEADVIVGVSTGNIIYEGVQGR
jgi:prepilin-type N-terminal cleavage/methylation domain-containing protein